jgi:Gpi18-like mannosyltransferase
MEPTKVWGEPADRRYVLPILLGTLVLCFGVFTTSCEGDLGCWLGWMRDLQQGGFAHLKANYPPILLCWFWVLAKTFAAFGSTGVCTPLLKAGLLFPILGVQVFTAVRLAKWVEAHGQTPFTSPLYWGYCLSPALFVDAPCWGQNDLLPFAAVTLAILCALDPARARWSLLWAGVALSCKFQAIAFAPVVAGLMLRQRKALLPAVAIGTVGFVACWTPFLIHWRFPLARAYVSNVSMFPFASYDGANLWMLLGRNRVSYRISLLTGLQAPGLVEKLATPYLLGLMAFGLLSLWVAWQSWRQPQRAWTWATLVYTGFFCFSAGMHERYLFLAVPAAAFAAAAEGRLLWVYGALNLLCAVNMALLLPPAGVSYWVLTSAGVLATFAVLFVGTLGKSGAAALDRLADLVGRVPATAYWGSFLIWASVIGYLLAQTSLAFAR